ELHGFKETTEMFHGNHVHAKQGIKLYTTDEETIHSEGIDKEVEGDWIIFATRHQAASGKKCFCAHVPGNWDKAEAGGSEKQLCKALPGVMKQALKKIESYYAGDEFEVIQECTHHGPFIDKPCMFIEIGSSEAEWARKDAGEVIAKVVNHVVMNPVKKYKEVVVLGGGHYNQVATKLVFNTEYAVGHICPKYMLPELDPRLLKQAIERNGENFGMVVLDWKGLGTEKGRIVPMLDEMGVKHERYQKLSKEE
ncbi:D-aminoacyl-tRNA deacylase, partial [Candidatus Woesearchaeota archaeon]|nr:D-aminoacyl-tRNA deacylase [Candidatus Woesearchaeota archaeon]